MDSSLVVRAQQGDREAFTGIVDAVGGRLHAIAFSVLRDRDLARDATQQTLLTVWRDLGRLRDHAPAPALVAIQVVPFRVRRDA